MVQEPVNSNRLTVAKLASSKTNNRVTELSPVPLNKVTVEPRHQLAQELDRVTALKEELELPSNNKAMAVLKLEVLLELGKDMALKEELRSSNRVTAVLRPQLVQELDKDMVEHQTVNRSQPTLTTQTAMATLSLRHPPHPTNKRFENIFPLYFFAIVINSIK